jgi:hypothetical protein
MNAASPFEVGKSYLIPTVLYPWFNRTKAWPILGPLHDDVEFFDFNDKHYHVDHRFLTHREVAFLNRNSGWRMSGLERAFGSPLCHYDRAGERQALAHPKPILKRRLCRREWSAFPRDLIPAVDRMQAAFAGRELIRKADDLICPHRGVSLATIRPDANGIITCPLHGLQFCSKTGRAISNEFPKVAA